jgi:hypothetical protein
MVMAVPLMSANCGLRVVVVVVVVVVSESMPLASAIAA